MPPPPFRPELLRIHPALVLVYETLEGDAFAGRKPQQGIWRRFLAARQRIGEDASWGDVIPFHRIPDYFRVQYDAKNLYCIDLKGDVRCFYTIDERDVIFLDIVDHDEYDRWFPPKGRRARR